MYISLIFLGRPLHAKSHANCNFFFTKSDDNDGGHKTFSKKGRAQIYHLCIYTNHATRFLLLKKPANRESLGIDTDLETALPAFFSASAARLSAKITAGVVFSLSDEVGVG